MGSTGCVFGIAAEGVRHQLAGALLLRCQARETTCQPRQRGGEGRCRAAIDHRFTEHTAVLLDDGPDGLLQGMRRVSVAIEGPPCESAGAQHGRMFPGAVVRQRLFPPPSSQPGRERCLIAGKVSGVLEVRRTQPGHLEDAQCPFRVHGLPEM